MNANPIKLREYLAMGKPIVSVSTPEIDKYADVVRIARTYEEFLHHLDVVISSDSSPAEIERRVQRVAQEGWDARLRAVMTIVQERLDERATRSEYQTSQELRAGRLCFFSPPYNSLTARNERFTAFPQQPEPSATSIDPTTRLACPRTCDEFRVFLRRSRPSETLPLFASYGCKRLARADPAGFKCCDQTRRVPSVR